MKGSGADVDITATILSKSLQWQTSLLFSFAKSNVSGYSMSASLLANAYLSESFINPVIGNPLFSIYSFRWAGLDASNGNPMGYIDGIASSDYSKLVTKTLLDSVVFAGSIQPSYFGAIRNTLSWKKISLSFNTSYKLDYFFRRPSVNYGTLFTTWSGHQDYESRWQKSGDETFTNVPALIFPANTNRDRFYSNADILVEKADHIRLEDLNLSYDFESAGKRLFFRHLKLYAYARIGAVLWSANKKGIDPYYINSPRPGKSIAFGMNVNF